MMPSKKANTTPSQSDPLQVLLQNEARLATLEEFYRTVVDLTLNHDGAHFYITDNHERKLETDIAMVSPAKLGAALQKVDPEWWKPARMKK